MKSVTKYYHNTLYKLGFEKRKKLQNLFYDNVKEIRMLDKPCKTCVVKKHDKNFIISLTYHSINIIKKMEIPPNFADFRIIFYPIFFEMLAEAHEKCDS